LFDYVKKVIATLTRLANEGYRFAGSTNGPSLACPLCYADIGIDICVGLCSRLCVRVGVDVVIIVFFHLANHSLRAQIDNVGKTPNVVFLAVKLNTPCVQENCKVVHK
jgi:hypothetical protein